MTTNAFWQIALPFIGFALTLLFKPLKWQKAVSLLFASMYLGFTGWILWFQGEALPLVLNLGGWPSPFGISLQIDSLSAILLVLTGILYFCVILYAVPGVNAERSKLLFPLIHVLVCGISGAFTTADLFNLYVWFEVILLSSFVLLTLGDKPARLAGAFKYVILNILSSLLFLTAAGLVYNSAHTLNFEDLVLRLNELQAERPSFVVTLNALLLGAFAIKAALVPFFYWLPASYHHMSPAVSGFFAGLLTKVGIYAIFRVNLLIFPAHDYITHLVVLMACASMLFGVAGAIAEKNIRRILGYHIISQVGFITFAGVFIASSEDALKVAGLAAGVFYMAHHILVKANLFFVSGIVRRHMGSERVDKVSGLLSVSPVAALLFAIPAMSLGGIPPLSGFWAKVGLFQSSMAGAHYAAIAVMIVGGFFTVFSMSKIWIAVFWGEVQAVEKNRGTVPFGSWLACTVLCCLTVAIGIYPDLLFDLAYLAAKSLVCGDGCTYG